MPKSLAWDKEVNSRTLSDVKGGRGLYLNKKLIALWIAMGPSSSWIASSGLLWWILVFGSIFLKTFFNFGMKPIGSDLNWLISSYRSLDNFSKLNGLSLSKIDVKNK